MRLTSNHIFGFGNFWDKSPMRFLKIEIPNRPPRYVITSTNLQLYERNFKYIYTKSICKL